MENTLMETCTVSRLSSQIDAAGSATQAQTVVGTYPCRVNVKSAPSNIELGESDTVRSQWEVSLPIAADVTDLDVLSVGEHRYTVLDTDAGRTGALLLVARCRKDT